MTADAKAPTEEVAVKKPDPKQEKDVVGDIFSSFDKSMDPELDDKKTMDRLKQPFVQRMFTWLVAMLFMLFGTYFIAFLFKIPLPESEIFKKFMDIVVEVMKVLVPPK